MALTTTPSELTATALTITTAAQPNITSVGTLTGLTVSGNIAGTLTTAAQTNITSLGTLTGLTSTGAVNITGAINSSADTTIATFGRAGSAVSASIIYADASTDMEFGTTTSHALSLTTADTRRLTINNSGNVGINTTTIAANTKLHIKTSTDHNLEFEEASGDLRISALNDARSVNEVLQFAASEFNFLTGNVGIGNTAPNSILHLGAANNSNHEAILTLNNGGATGNEAGIEWLYEASTTPRAKIFLDASSQDLVFQTANATALIINSSGNVGIGTPSVSLGSTDLVLQVGSSSYSTPTIQIRSSTTGTGQLWFGDNSGTDVGRYDGYIEYGQTNRYMAFGTANTTALLIDSSQRGLFGHTSSQAFVWASVQPKLQVEGTDASSAAMSITRNSANGSPPYLILAKSRGGSVNSNTVVVDDDVTGEIMFAAADGTNKETRTASIYSAVDGTPGSDDMPGRLVFSTTQDGNAAPTTALTINSSQNATFAGNVTANNLYVADDIVHSGDTDTYMSWNANNLTIYNGGVNSLYLDNGKAVFNEGGGGVEFRVESSNATNAIYVSGTTGNIGMSQNPDANWKLNVYSGDYYTAKLRAPSYPVLAFEALNINSGNNGRISVGADNKFVLQTANAAGNTAIVMHDGKLGAGGGSDMTPDVALDVQGPVKIRANSAGGVSQSYTNMTAANSGKIIIPFAAIGTLATSDTIVFEYAATAWKSWFFKIRWSSTGGYMGELWAGGYNNNSDGFTIKNPYAGSADSSGLTADGMTLTVSRSGQENTFTLTCTTSHVHPMFEIEYACGGGEGYPIASRCSLSVNS